MFVCAVCNLLCDAVWCVSVWDLVFVCLAVFVFCLGCSV